jgi:putative Mg2+ transporter-C (MgtC) family protein
MRLLNWMENRLPRRFSLYVNLTVLREHQWTVEKLVGNLRTLGIIVHEDSIALKVDAQISDWGFMVSAINKHHLINVVDLSRAIMQLEEIESFSVQPARN